MANEKRLIDMDDTMNKLRAYAERKHEAEHYELANGILKAVNYIQNNIVRVDAVEVPCKVGDMVHRKDGSWNVVGFECDRGGSWKVKLERWKDQFWDCHESTKVVFKSFGKTVFLSSAEAEAALAKMDGDGNA